MSNTKNVVPIKSTPVSVFLRQLLDIEDDIESIIVTCHQKSTDKTHTYHTQASNQDLIWMAWCMQDEVNGVVNGIGEE